VEREKDIFAWFSEKRFSLVRRFALFQAKKKKKVELKTPKISKSSTLNPRVFTIILSFSFSLRQRF